MIDDSLATLSETVSEKPKRGRPKLLSESIRMEFAAFGMQTEVQTERGQQNLFYQQIAVSQLMDDERFNWILGGSSAEILGHTAKKMRRTILQELGRILDDDQIIAVALEICKRKLTTTKAKDLIRRFRDCPRKRADALDLANEIIRTINAYFDRHPETTNEQVLNALWTAAAQVEQCQEPGDGDGGQTQ